MWWVGRAQVQPSHPRPLVRKQLRLIVKPTQMAIPLQMELKSFANSWSLQCGALKGASPEGYLKGVDLESESQ
jgi:hypothetical protein